MKETNLCDIYALFIISAEIIYYLSHRAHSKEGKHSQCCDGRSKEQTLYIIFYMYKGNDMFLHVNTVRPCFVFPH